MDGIADRVVAITGAGRGIGGAVAEVLAREGAKVVVNDLGVALDGSAEASAPAQDVVERIVAAGGEACANGEDIADFLGAERLLDQAITTYGRLDVLINVAGILRDRMLFNLSEQDWDAVIRVHLKGTFNTSRHAAAYWREQRNPDGNFRLINFTSGAGLHGAPTQPNYAAVKMGIVGFTYSCADGLSKYGVTANCVAPAAMTRMMDTIQDEGSRIEPNILESGKPENVTPIVAYLASTRSSWCNGQVLSARGLDIGLYTVPSVVRLITSPAPWSLETAFELIERVFVPVVTGESS